MADQRNGISWCDETWSPTRGCQRVSEGCRHCWAERMAARLSGPGRPYEGLIEPVHSVVHTDEYRDETGAYCGQRDYVTAVGPRWTGRARFVPEMLERPLRWRKPRRIAVSLMGDVFHNDITNEQIAAVFGVAAACPDHQFLILTKRPQRMLEWFTWIQTHRGPGIPFGGAEFAAEEAIETVWPEGANEAWNVRSFAEPIVGKRLDIRCDKSNLDSPAVPWPLPNVFVGISAENQQTLEERWQYLARVPAAVRWISLEPLLGPVDLHQQITRFCGCPQAAAPDPCDDWKAGDACQFEPPRAHWIVAGGESGPRARPSNVQWYRSIRRQCHEADVPFHMKQLGACPVRTHNGKRQMEVTATRYPITDSKGAVMKDWPPDLRIREWPEVGNA